MWEEYDEYYEKSELENAFDEFLNKVQEYAKEGVKSQIKDIELREQENKAKSDSLWSWENKLEARQNELDKREKDIENKKNEIILEFLSKYGLDLKIGQKVYYLKDISTSSECPTCNGKGKLQKEIDGLIYETKCPSCNYGRVKEEKYEIKEDYVRTVSFKFYASKDRVAPSDCEWEFNTIYLDNARDYYHREKLFLTKEETMKKLAELEGK